MDAPKVRTVFVLPSLVRAGAETQVVNLVNGLDPKKFEKHLFVFEAQLDQLERVDRLNVAFHHCVRRHKFDLTPSRVLADLIDAQSIDIVHCSLQIALFVGWIAIKFAKRKPRLVLALHTTQNSTRRDDIFDAGLYQWLMRSCSRVICVCRAQDVHWRRRFPFLTGRTSVVYNGVDTEWFDPEQARDAGRSLREQLQLRVTDFVACTIAGFRPEKGHGHLIRAFARVVNSRPDSYLLLAGDGPTRLGTEACVRQHGIEQNVRFLGTRGDVRTVLAASDVSVMPSTSETFSMAMLESLAMGVPVIATDVGGAMEAVKPGITGLLVPVGDDRALAQSIMELARDPEMRSHIGARGRTEVCEKFTYQMMIENTRHVLVSECVTEGVR